MKINAVSLYLSCSLPDRTIPLAGILSEWGACYVIHLHMTSRKIYPETPEIGDKYSDSLYATFNPGI
jgi:hypothetical protein